MYFANPADYVYHGEMRNGKFHGRGELTFKCGGYYKGEFKNACIDGFGVYTTDKFRYTGFFSINHYHGLGTMEFFTTGAVYKGSWRNDKKHGPFRYTNTACKESYYQYFDKDKLVHTRKIQYVDPMFLMTKKENPWRRGARRAARQSESPRQIPSEIPSQSQIPSEIPSQSQIPSQSESPSDRCIVCMTNKKNATNPDCGHVVLCYDCLNKCNRCPICRTENKNIIRLFMS